MLGSLLVLWLGFGALTSGGATVVRMARNRWRPDNRVARRVLGHVAQRRRGRERMIPGFPGRRLRPGGAGASPVTNESNERPVGCGCGGSCGSCGG